MVMMKVCEGLILGITANTVSPTRPREVDAIPDVLTLIPNPTRSTSATHSVTH